MTVNAGDVISLMNELAPQELAEKWDHPGLQIGNPDRPVDKVLVSLDVTESNVDYAIRQGISMIISHHPFLFHPIQSLDLRTAKGRMIEKLIKHDILTFAAHTNLDTASGGVNDALSAALDLSDLEGLVPGKKYKSFKIDAYMSAVKARQFHHELQVKYPEESGHFYLLDDEDDFTAEEKMEFNISEKALPAVLSDLHRICGPIHYDIYPLENNGKREFMGRIGSLPSPLPGRKALEYVKEKLGIPVLRFCGNTQITVKKVAVLGGAGSEFAALAKARGADLYVTGDLKYHEAQDAASLGLLVADAGHFYTERVIISHLAGELRKEAKVRGWDISIIEDSSAVDIFGQL